MKQLDPFVALFGFRSPTNGAGGTPMAPEVTPPVVKDKAKMKKLPMMGSVQVSPLAGTSSTAVTAEVSAPVPTCTSSEKKRMRRKSDAGLDNIGDSLRGEPAFQIFTQPGLLSDMKHLGVSAYPAEISASGTATEVTTSNTPEVRTDSGEPYAGYAKGKHIFVFPYVCCIIFFQGKARSLTRLFLAPPPPLPKTRAHPRARCVGRISWPTRAPSRLAVSIFGLMPSCVKHGRYRMPNPPGSLV